jgi:hypothetical protein
VSRGQLRALAALARGLRERLRPAAHVVIRVEMGRAVYTAVAGSRALAIRREAREPCTVTVTYDGAVEGYDGCDVSPALDAMLRALGRVRALLEGTSEQVLRSLLHVHVETDGFCMAITLTAVPPCQ